MKKVLRVLKLRGVSISDQLRWEEILLRRSKDNWYVRCNDGGGIVSRDYSRS